MSDIYARCWAYGPTGQRCEKDASHTLSDSTSMHSVSTEWTDDECVTPEHFATARVVGETRSVRPIPIIAIGPEDEDDDEPGMDRCAACGWPEVGHDQNTAGCKRFA